MLDALMLVFLLVALVVAMVLVAALFVGLVVGACLAVFVWLPVALNRALQRRASTWQESLALALVPAVGAALVAGATGGAELGLVVGGTWLAMGAGVAWTREGEADSTLVPADRIDLAWDPRWRMAWWTLAAVLAVCMPPGAPAVGAAAAAGLVGCLHAQRRLRVLQRGLLLTERVLWRTRETFLDADTLTLRAEPTWWGGRIELAHGVKVRTGELPRADWLASVRRLARHAAPHLADAPGRGALEHLRGARAAG